MMLFITFVLVVILLFWVSGLSGRVKSLEKRLSEGVVSIPKSQGMAQKNAAEPESKPFITAPEYSALDVGKTIPAAAATATATEPKQPIAHKTPSFTTQDSFNWLTKFGVLAIALGVVFFFKFAIDQGWVSEWMRVVFGFVVGGLFIVLGELWKDKYSKYSYALSGGGILILDFTIYAAFNFYHLLPQFISLALMVAASGFAVWLSVKRKSLALAVLGIVGAFGAPLLLSSGQSQQVLLFSYLTILNVAVLAVMLRKFWMELGFLAFIGTIFDFGVWSASFSTQANTWTSVIFVIITACLFVLVLSALFRRHAAQQSLPQNVDNNFGIFSVLCGLFFLASTWGLMHTHFHDFLWLIALLGAVIWWVAYLLVDRLDFSGLNQGLSLVGTTLVVLAAYWQFTGKTFDVLLILISVISLLIGYFVKRGEFRTWGMIVLYGALLKVSFEPYGAGDKQFLLNAKFALMFLETAALVFAGWLYSKIEVRDSEKQLQSLSETVAALLLWIAVSWDISNAFRGLGGSQSMSLWWVLYPAVLAWLALVGKRSLLSGIALLLLVIGSLKVLFLPYDSTAYIFLLNAKFGLMFLQTLAFLAIASMQTEKEGIKKEGDTSTADLLKVFASLYLWFAVSWEITQYFSVSSSSNARNLLLSMWWMGYGVVLILASTIKGFSLYRKVAVAFFALAIAKVFLFDVGALDLGYRIVSFIVLGIILLSVSFAYQKNKEKIVTFLAGNKS